MVKSQIKIYNRVEELPESWNALPNNDVFLKTAFLSALEQSSPKNITTHYIGVFKAEELVGIAIVQRVEMYLEDIFRNNNDKYITRKSKQLISKIVRGNTLVVGNIMHTGQHGLYFNTEEISYKEYLNQLSIAIEQIKSNLKQKHDKKVRLIAFKDYFEDDSIHNNQAFFKTQKLYKIQVQPNMVFNIPESWTILEDYTSSFTKKYRDRFKSARKKGKQIIKRELSIEDLTVLQSEIFKLYKEVSDNARVNSFILSENHFKTLKQELKADFKVFGYFIDEELVGFFTLILNNKTLETYFLGYNPEFQYKHQIYLNMLFDMAQFAIENNFKNIVYARTAMEIKSSVGAKPKAMHIYMKHTNFIANSMLKLIVKYLNPVTKWVERHPFK
ncbi:GNAT family N-acetyltransferase [Lacinutrix sp. Bg11-31]|uniref:GNAT family N-acetyltransferase n=1 Tax=Lacinutrix sp. Bg11-31 TaxID=2057808 RepID=UPI000C30D3E1|nr:GNAT family N-acetyltransferase [Lacinutrix sp. Bg11-31]AUC82982.1 GNAT family N-acetyltransferase [Lacinutrix sp. Bg11-31]